MKRVITFILTNLLVATLYATDSGKEIVVLHFNHGDSISLRWIPANEKLIEKSLTHGYIVQRREKGESKWNSISPELKPLSNKEMEIIESYNEDIYPLREVLYKEGRKEYEKEKYSNTKYLKSGFESVQGEQSFEDAMLYAMAVFGADISLQVAKAGALIFVDKNIEKNTTYEYRVVFSDQTNIANANVGIATVNTSQKTQLPVIEDFTAQFEEHYVDFQWTMEKLKGYYSAFRIERSTDSIHFTPLKKRPFIHSYTKEELKNIALYKDSLPNQDDTFYYRITGYSPFGFYGPYSKIWAGQAKLNFKQISIEIDTIIFKKNHTEIQWSVDKKFQKRIKGLQVMRTRDFQEFKPLNTTLLPTSSKKFSDKTNINSSNYYGIVAYGYNEGEVSNVNYVYAHYNDSIPPIAPNGLKAIIDSSGIVTITWTPNRENDIFAYRLYSSNSGKEEDYFTVKGTYLKDTLYNDTVTLNTITKNKYYKVTAIDRSYNESNWSEAVKITKPDTIAPVGAVFKLIQQEKEGDKIVVKWDNTPSEDAIEMELYRQIDDTGKVVLVKKYDLTKRLPNEYNDPYSFSGEFVQYFMVVRDDAGNKTTTHSNRLTTLGERPGCIKNLQSRVINEEKRKCIEFKWEHNSSNITRYVIYKKVEEERMLPIASLQGNKTYFEDKEVVVGLKYNYIIRPITSERVCPAEYSEEIIMGGYIE